MNENPEDTVVSTNYVPVPVGVATQVIGQNQRRRAICFSACNGSSFYSPNQNVALTIPPSLSNPGFNLGSGFPLIFSRVLHGALATCAWFAFAPTSADTAMVVEVLDK